jgi:uncharacterized integral membrane protein
MFRKLFPDFKVTRSEENKTQAVTDNSNAQTQDMKHEFMYLIGILLLLIIFILFYKNSS